VTPRIGVCDYGVGNLRSVQRALVAAGATPVISGDADEIAACDGVILPGVGAFASAAAVLHGNGLAAAIRSVAADARPVLGVCLGHQLLFEHSDEGEGGEGLGLLSGAVSRLHVDGLKVPHMGWNRLRMVRYAQMLDGIDDGAYVYFVHSYTAIAAGDDVVAVTDYGGELAAVVERGSVTGMQFHPEKSGPAGLRVYANFVAACQARTRPGVTVVDSGIGKDRWMKLQETSGTGR
jgi:glutamine amidotransferase